MLSLTGKLPLQDHGSPKTLYPQLQDHGSTTAILRGLNRYVTASDLLRLLFPGCRLVACRLSGLGLYGLGFCLRLFYFRRPYKS